MTPLFVKQGNPQGELFTALANMLTRAQPSSTRVDAPYVAQMQAQRQQNAFEQAKQEDYYNKLRALAELRAQGTSPSAMWQKANNFVGDFIIGNTPQQMVENVALSAMPIGKMMMAVAPLVGKTRKLFHGTGKLFDGFKDVVENRATGNPTSMWGTFFAPNENEAIRYVNDFHGGSGKLVSANVELKNPYMMSSREFDSFTTPKDLSNPNWNELNKKAAEFKKQLSEMGYDGIIIKPNSPYEETVVFNPKSIGIVGVKDINR